MAITDAPEYISLSQFAKPRGISPRTARRYVAEGRLKAVRFSERCIRVHRDEVARFDAEAARNIGPASA